MMKGRSKRCGDFDRSTEVSGSCRNMTDGQSCHSKKGGQPDSNKRGIGKANMSPARRSSIFPRGSGIFTLGKCRNEPSWALESQSTNDTLEQQQRNVSHQHVINGRLDQRCSGSSPEHHPNSIHVGPKASTREPQHVQDERRSQHPQQLSRCAVTGPLRDAIAVGGQYSMHSKQECGSGWRNADTGVLFERDSFSSLDEKDASDTVLLPVSLSGPQLGAERYIKRAGTRGGTGTCDSERGWERCEAELKPSAASNGTEEEERAEAEERGRGEDQMSIVTIQEKCEEFHSTEEVPPEYTSRSRTSETSSGTPLFPRVIFRGLSLRKESAKAPHSRRGFMRSASTAADRRESVKSSKAPATASAAVRMKPQASNGELCSRGEVVPASLNCQMQSKSAGRSTGLVSVQEPSLNICLLPDPGEAQRLAALKATRSQATHGVSGSGPSAVKTGKAMEDKASLQGEKSKVLTVGGKGRQNDGVSAQMGRGEEADGTKGQREVGSEVLSEEDRSDARQERSAPEHHNRDWLFHMQCRKRSLKRFFSGGGSTGTSLLDEPKHFDPMCTKEGSTRCGKERARAEGWMGSDNVIAEDEKARDEEGNRHTWRKRAASLFASLRSSSLRELGAAGGNGPRVSERRQAGAAVEETTGGRGPGGRKQKREGACAEGHKVGKKKRAQKSGHTDTCGSNSREENSDYAAYLEWHEDKWGEKIFDQIEVADIDLFDYPLRRGLGCVIM